MSEDMCNEEIYKVIKDQLDKELETKNPSVGIKFGTDIFHCFRKFGWIQYKPIQRTGSSENLGESPYYGTHPAICDTTLRDDEYRVGA